MMLTTKGRYAVMAMVDIAAYGTKGPITLGQIAERQHIAVNYLEQIFAKLRKEGLVKAYKGPGGGYELAIPAASIRISDVITAAEEPIKMIRCGNEPTAGCMHDRSRCLTHELWEGLGQHIHSYLHSVTLADLCEKAQTRAALWQIAPEMAEQEEAR